MVNLHLSHRDLVELLTEKLANDSQNSCGSPGGSCNTGRKLKIIGGGTKV